MEAPLILLFLSFIIFLILGMPIAWVLLSSSLIYLLLKGTLPAVLPQRVVVMLDSFVLIAVPFFIYMALIMNTGKITDKIFIFARLIVGRVRGGLGYVNIVASVIFAGMSGSMLADIMGLGEIEIKAMLDAGYDRKFSAAVTAASSIIGPIIPPSIVLIIYGFLSGTSISRLLVGGIVPGLTIAAYQMVIVYIISTRRNYPIEESKFEWKKLSIGFKNTFPALITPIIVLGGIMIGFVTPTEAAVIASVYATLIAIFFYRSINHANEVFLCFKETALTASRILLICAFAAAFGWILTWERIPQKILELIIDLNISKIQFLLIFDLIVLFLGCFISANAIIIMLTPLVTPLFLSMGINPVHFGVMFIFAAMIGLLTPPFGIGLFAISNIAKVDIYELSIELIPFLIGTILALITITIFPGIVLFLPNLLFG